jgi:hypothetical protein
MLNKSVNPHTYNQIFPNRSYKKTLAFASSHKFYKNIFGISLSFEVTKLFGSCC